MDREERDMGARRKAGIAGPVSTKARRLSLGLLVALLALTVLTPAARAVVPELLVKVPEESAVGAAAGKLFIPGAIAADPGLPGHVYVIDVNNRINVFTPWGEFVKAFGWKVDAANPEEKLQACTTLSGCQQGSEGGGAGQLNRPQALAVDSAGNLYVAEGGDSSDGNRRIQKFGPGGEFLAAIGGDVIAHGPGDSTNDEIQQLAVAASSGSFKLGFANPFTGAGKQETAALPFNASAAEVKAALNALATIGGLGGSVSVTGGPGNPTGSAPYTITFEANTGGDDVPQLSIDRSGLGADAIGAMLRCSTTTEASEIEFNWLRNGEEIAGAESPTYTTVAADEGKSIQCQVTARNSAESVAIGVANPVYVAPPVGGVAPPVAPGRLTARPGIGQHLEVGKAGGQTLTCGDGSGEESFKGATSLAYRWYRSGVQIAGATASTYVVTEADLASPAYFQCAATASNAGTATTTKFSSGDGAITNPGPTPRLPEGSNVQVSMDPPSHVFTAHQGGAPEVCGPTDTCKAGVGGVDSGYLDVERYDDKLAISPVDDALYLAEGGGLGEADHIQVFEPDGSFREEIELPSPARALTVDDAGTLHVALVLGGSKFAIRTLAPHGPLAEFSGPTIAAESIFSLAVDTAGNTYAARIGASGGVLEFGPAGNCLNCGSAGEGGKEGFDRVEGGIKGIATARACGVEDVYVSHDTFPPAESRQGYFNIFGPPPNPTLCPQPKVPPELIAQYATSVDADSAELRAQINPRFWDDTTYYLEYGTSPCSEGGCEAKPPPPGALLTSKVTQAKLKTAGIVLEGLEAGTTYHYRFITESGGGGPVLGPDRTFTTFRSPGAQSCPANEALRAGPSAALPDCRAYEMVSPLDKDGGDIFPLASFSENLPATLNQSSLDGSRLSYGTYHSFGSAESAPFTTQFIAARGEGGWTSHGISPPHGRLILTGGKLVDTELKALSPDLCEAWLRSVSEPVLAEGAVVGYPNLYRRTDDECGGPSFEALTTVEPPNLKPAAYFSLELAGFSADRQTTLYGVNDSLPGSGASLQQPACASDARACTSHLYLQRAGEALPHFVCILPDGSAAGACEAGTNNRDPDRDALFQHGNYQGALSADGERVFWSAPVGTNRQGPIYMRENSTQPQSALAHGAASGSGDLTEGSEKVTALIAAEGEAEFTVGSPTATLLTTKVGRFVAGQPVTALGKVPAGTTIKAVSGQTLTLDKNATSSGTKTIFSKGPMPFEVGQAISGTGIPPKTTITEAKGGELKLSKAASVSASGVALVATSDCTEAAKACTLAVSAEAEALSGSQQSEFWAAAADGSAAIFTTTGGAYRFDVDSETTTKIGGGVVGVSEDASRVYVGTGACGGPGSKAGIYLYETGDSCAAGDMDFVVTLGVGDQATVSGTEYPVSNHTRRVSPDGTHFAFMSLGQPTGYDNLDAETGEPAAEVYLYDAAAEGGQGKLVCASCNPSGARPHGRTPGNKWEVFPFAIFGTKPRIAAQIPGYENNLYAPRVLSDDGTRLFFESFDSLSLRDTNGRRDVYQWEALGTGSCEEGAPSYYESNGGCIELISSGQSGSDSRLADASADGSDVFFTTGESLLGADFGLIDVYDARINGGFPEPDPPAPQCEGEACQNAPEAPNDPTPASETFQGAGNVKEEAAAPIVRKPCAKGKVRRKGRCVARKHKKAAKAKRANRNRRAGR